MKRKIVSFFTLLAMSLSIFLDSASFLNSKVAADDPVNEETLMLQMLFNGKEIDRTFNAFQTTGNVSFKVVNRIRTPDGQETFEDVAIGGDVEVYYSTSNVNKTLSQIKRDTYTGPLVGGKPTVKENDPSAALQNDGFGGVPIGINGYIAERVVDRHAGGISPVRTSAGVAGTGTTKYTGGNIALPAFREGDNEVFTVSAIAYKGSGLDEQKVRITRTFVLMSQTSTRVKDWAKNYGEMMVVSLYVDDQFLWGHENGVMGAGIDREEWILEYQRINANEGRLQGLRPGRDGVYVDGAFPTGVGQAKGDNRTRPDFIDYGLMQAYGSTMPANYNRSGRGKAVHDTVYGGAEIPSFVEIFDHNGMRHIAQGAGLRVKGGWSRGTYIYEQKTFEIYARKGYNDYYGGGRLDSFLFPLFETMHNVDNRTTAEGNLIHEYRRFRIRNGGTDRDRAHMRDEIYAEFVKQSGHMTPAQSYRPAAVFLNGAYYGLTFMKSPRTENHWDKLYGGRESAFHLTGKNEINSDPCFSNSCKRVINETAPNYKEVTSKSKFLVQADAGGGPISGEPYWGARDKAYNGNLMAKTKSASEAKANEYVGYMPKWCTDSSPCGRPDCNEFWADKSDICLDHNENTCYRGRDCTGCIATCDWAEIVDLISGVEIEKSSSGKSFPATSFFRRTNHAADQSSSCTSTKVCTTCARVEPNGLTDPARWEEFERRVDIKAYMHYYAINLFDANVDWPANNFEMWRYWPQYDVTPNTGRERDGEVSYKKMQENPEAKAFFDNVGVVYDNSLLTEGTNPQLDGRWRPISFDGEFGFGLFTSGANPNQVATAGGWDSIGSTINRTSPPGVGHFGASTGTFFLRAVCGGDAVAPTSFNENNQPAIPYGPGTVQAENRKMLANAIADYMEGPVSEENAQAIIERVAWVKEAEHKLALGSEYITDEYTNAPLKQRRIAEIARGSMQFGYRVDTSWPEDAGGGRVFDVWPQWDGGGDNKDHDDIGTDIDTIRLFLSSKGADNTGWNNTQAGGETIKRNGRLNPQLGMPAHIKNSLGLDYQSGRTLSITVSLPASGYGASGNGYLIVNNQPFGMEGLGWNGDNAPDVRMRGRNTGDTRIPSSFTSKYFPTTAGIPVTAKPYPGYRVVWPSSVPNATTLNSAACCTSSDAENTAYLTTTTDLSGLKFERCPHYIDGTETSLVINTVRAIGFTNSYSEYVNSPEQPASNITNQKGDWLEISNPTNKTLSTKGMFLSDDNKEDEKFKLPSLIVHPQSKIYIPTESNTAVRAGNRFTWENTKLKAFVKRAKADFNLAFGERLRLNSRALNNLGKSIITELSRAEISVMTPDQIQLRTDNGNFRIWNVGAEKPMEFLESPGVTRFIDGETYAYTPNVGAAEARSRTVRNPGEVVVKCPICKNPIDDCTCPPCADCGQKPCTCVAKIIWQPNLTGATNTDLTGRNYITDASGTLLGFGTSSGNTSSSTGEFYGTALTIQGNSLVYENNRSTDMRLNVFTGGNAGGPTFTDGKSYKIKFTAKTPTGGAATFRFVSGYDAAGKPIYENATPIVGTLDDYEQTITWPIANAEEAGDKHGTPVFGMSTKKAVTIVFTNFEIWELPNN